MSVVGEAIRHMPAIVQFLGYDPLPPEISLRDRLVSARTALGLSQRKDFERVVGYMEVSPPNRDAAGTDPSPPNYLPGQVVVRESGSSVRFV
jgi:hypothetical protein